MTLLQEQKIVVADDHPVARLAVVSTIHALRGPKVAAGVSSGRELLQVLSMRAPGYTCLRALTWKRPHLSRGMNARLPDPGKIGSGSRSTRVLTPEELEVVRQFGLGTPLIESARPLNRAKTTVAKQKRSAMQKLRINSKADLNSSAREQGLF